MRGDTLMGWDSCGVLVERIDVDNTLSRVL